MEGLSVVTWRKSSFSGGNGGQCVEVADKAHVVLVRDTTERDGAVLSIPANVWQTFTDGLK